MNNETSNFYGVQNTYRAIRDRLLSYINTEYFGKCDTLRAACADELKKVGVLYQKPYIEANNAYEILENGIDVADIDEDVKKILNLMIERKLGVFKNPYKHQIEALEAYFKGKDLFVFTGTGSGKTECFMWPMVSKLVLEQMRSPKTWEVRGIRAIMLYPMNALVTDQIGRLRHMIGNYGGFHDVISKLAPGTRIPQFGMYTGRTPYPGEFNKRENEGLADTLEKNIINKDDSVKEKLHELGKYPSKKDLKAFVERLQSGSRNLTDPYDSELITRQEMQRNCPDILISNYSMLEYMLMRPIEKSLWESTCRWLSSNPQNKLLFIIDEAHMYHGASGAEVALLIRRVLNKLNISRDRVQFILTSASVPDKEEDVDNFACDLSAQSRNKKTFAIIKGTKAPLATNGREFEPEVLKGFNLDAFHGNWSDKRQAIKDFGRLVGFDELQCNFDNEIEVGNWLYNQFQSCGPMLRIMKKTRGQATSLQELSKIAFPNCKNCYLAENAVNVLLAIAPLAKDINGSVLYPARLHLMFRGLQGVYACLNKNCNCNGHKASALNLGRIYIDKPGNRCTCGGLIYELVNERTCGALFIKGYIKPEQFSDDCFVWNEPNQGLSETHFYIVDESYRREEKHKVAWLNSVTGKLLDTDEHAGDDRFIQVVYTDESSNQAVNGLKVNTFKKCPKCGKANFHATDFSTKGNEPFYNLVSEQFRIQPPVQKYKKQTNQGRKVLLFSDSRQRAAVLAKDLTEAADEEAMRKALTMAAKDLQNWAEEHDEQPKLNLLYWAFVKVAYERELDFFYGDSAKKLCEDIEKVEGRYKKGQGSVNYGKLENKYTSRPQKYEEHLLKQFCSNFHSLIDAGLCWIEPCIDEEDEEVIQETFLENKIDISLDEFKHFFTSWGMKVMVSYYALDGHISDATRKRVATYSGHRFGITEDEIMPSNLKSLLKDHKKLDPKQIGVICSLLKKDYLEQQQGRDKYYLNPKRLIIRFDENHQWYKCPRCSSIFPYTLWGKCAHCMQGKPKLMSKADFEGISFWRDPALEAIDKPDTLVSRINTEEHTAQLSHKDQRQEVWSTTEDFEMRFQNVSVDDKHPVDVLSCTTTMEVGIDIGSLVAVGLRNIPPMRENYQQRAGRAGRRGAAISTIVTYADNRPHDSYYFHNPDEIISGNPRAPWIDVCNKKLTYRHLNVVFTTTFFDKFGLNDKKSALSVDSIKVDDFLQNYYDKFIEFISNLNAINLSRNILIPEGLQFDFREYKDKFIEELKDLKDQFEKFSAKYYDDNSRNKNIKSLLDAFLECGIFPTYSFARNIVGFYVESKDGKKIEQKPQRSLEIAISEYAPGRLVVINKEVYKSGGIYNFYSKFSPEGNHPARTYFSNDEYFKENLYCCSESKCNWMGLSDGAQEPKACPFCGASKLEKRKMLKPWGFAPLNGEACDEANPDFEITYAEEPCYSITPKKEQLKRLDGFEHLLYSKRSGDSIIILNKGLHASGFTVCKDCGAAVSGNKKIEDNVGIPYRDYKNRNCKHSSQINTYLGDQFVTDMILYVIELDKCKVNTDVGNLWMRRAGRTLAEAMALAGGRLLDIEFNEIRSGYRIRYSDDVTYLDVFLFDSLSSGAGYCSELADRSNAFIEKTIDVLSHCPNNCDSACYSCLKHYWNQQNHYLLDRHAALDLLNWAKEAELPKYLSYDEQAKLLEPINYLGAEFRISGDRLKHYVKYNGIKTEIVVYPDMRKEFGFENKIFISDKALKYDFPNAYSEIKQSVELISTI